MPDTPRKNTPADGLRGIAALNVVLTHFVAAFLPALLHRNYPSLFQAAADSSAMVKLLGSAPATLLYNGHFPVLVFFVLSGYVLTLPFGEGTAAGRLALQRRLWGRYLRLNIPIAVAVALSFMFYRLGWYSNVEASRISGSGWLAALYPEGISAATTIKDALYGAILFGNGTLIPPLWTLKIEFLGSVYLLVFHLVRPARWLPFSALFVLILLYLFHGPDSIYYYAIFAGSFLVGVRCRQRWLFFATGLYFGAFQYESAAYSFLPDPIAFQTILFDAKSLYNTVGAILLTFAVVHGCGSAFFNSRPVQFLGRISFSLYLIHFVVLCSLATYFFTHQPPTVMMFGINLALYLCASVAVANLFQVLVDAPAIRLSHRFSSCLFNPRTGAGS